MCVHTDSNIERDTPTVSVVMGVYNSATTLREAVTSIICQSYTDWELIICDDASSDGSYHLACQLAQEDSRIRVLRNNSNAGCNVVLNRCIEEARGGYIAIMDSDDISLPTRLEKEVNFLDNNSEYSIVGSAIAHFDNNGEYMTMHYHSKPQPHHFAYGIPHAHPTCMMRREAIVAVGMYLQHKQMQRVEDYYLQARMYAAGHRGYNLQEVLLQYRDDGSAYARRSWQNRLNEVYTYNKAIGLLHLSPILHIVPLRHLLVGLLPRPLYQYLHRRPWQHHRNKELHQK